jgi:hypothetical protein
MTALYAFALVLGVLGVVTWVVKVAIAETADRVAPDSRIGEVVGAVSGFGMAGMSASFGGFGVVPSFGAAVLGAVTLTALARILGQPS